MDRKVWLNHNFRITMLKLHDLTVGDRFTFTDKHRGKVFEVFGKGNDWVHYKDVATGEFRITTANRKTFRMPVQLVTENRVVELTPAEIDKLQWILYAAYTSVDSEEARSEINKMHIKLTGSAGRRVVLPEE